MSHQFFDAEPTGAYFPQEHIEVDMSLLSDEELKKQIRAATSDWQITSNLDMSTRSELELMFAHHYGDAESGLTNA